MMRRFCRYIEKVFDFGKQIHTLRDARKRPRIPTAALWGSVLFLFVMRHRSLNAMEQEIRQPKRVEQVDREDQTQCRPDGGCPGVDGARSASRDALSD